MLGCGVQESKDTATMRGDGIQLVKGDRKRAWAIQKIEKVTSR